MHEAVEPWVLREEPFDTEAIVVSPWSGATLPVRPFLQACFVWFGLANFWSLAQGGSTFRSSRLEERLDLARRGFLAGPLLERLPIELVETYWTPDGNFPDHEPNPLLPENRQFIIDKVNATGADLGIAWDGDADRCFFIDDGGEFVDGDFLTAILAEHLLAKTPGATILFDARASRAVPDTVSKAGGRALINRVGHAFFKARMPKEGAIFGGEVSGHYYFADFYNADSGSLPALLVLEKLSIEGRRMSELVGAYREKYFISGEINSDVLDQDAKMAEIEERYSDGDISHVDGVSVDYDAWHFNVRPSNTEPLLRLCLESLVSREDMERRRDEVLGLIRS